MAIDLDKKKVSNEKAASIAEKVLGGKQATREETRSLAAAALGVDGEKGGASSLAVKVVAGDHDPTPEEMKTLATTVVVQGFSTAIDRVRTLVADDNLLSRSDKNRIIKYLQAIEAITREYEPDRDRQVVNVLVDSLRKYAVNLTKRIGQGVAVQRVVHIVDNLTDLLPI
jgi:ABC-type antimicrobial peptide transport system ATPase subunit